jgi:hypothetical protein
VADTRLADRWKTPENTAAAELRNTATGETELYLSIENTIEERLRAFNRMMRLKLTQSKTQPRPGGK